MSAVNVTGVAVKNNPCSLSEPFCFEITFESLTDLEEDLDWRVIYCSSGDVGASTCRDVELDCVSLGPVTKGTLSFEFQAAPPNYSEMDARTLVGINAILVTASYRSEEFIRIGWYVNNLYVDQFLKENPPTVPLIDKLARLILDDEPRVTRFPILWDKTNSDLLLQPPMESAGNDPQPSMEEIAITSLSADSSMTTSEINPIPSSSVSSVLGNYIDSTSSSSSSGVTNCSISSSANSMSSTSISNDFFMSALPKMNNDGSFTSLGDATMIRAKTTSPLLSSVVGGEGGIVQQQQQQQSMILEGGGGEGGGGEGGGGEGGGEFISEADADVVMN